MHNPNTHYKQSKQPTGLYTMQCLPLIAKHITLPFKMHLPIFAHDSPTAI